MQRRGEQPWQTNRVRVLRDQQTSAEDTLWSKLRAKRLGGLKFVRQLPIGPYFADFACRSNNVVVEVDGGTHCTAEELAADERRTAFLQTKGYRVFRVSNSDIYNSLDGVLDTLLAFVEGRLHVRETEQDRPLSPTLSPAEEARERGKT
jgi:very-short-patch-repair endonuclease